ncbi:MAG: aminodeoxychorismate synthase component I [Saprospiraceae bacterium]
MKAKSLTKLCDKLPDWVEKMNELASDDVPFFFLISYDLKSARIHRLDDLADDIFFEIKGRKYGKKLVQQGVGINLVKHPFSLEEYLPGFKDVRHHIQAGNSYLANLTCRSKVELKGSLEQVYTHASAPYKLYVRDRFTLFSPECFVQIKDGNIYSFPMKGTIDANLPNAEQLILEDQKELAEHYTIVDLIRNDLSKVADMVEVKRFRYIDRVRTTEKTLLQVSSEICGSLPKDYKSMLGTIFYHLLPAGSICGAPKKKTCEILASVETHVRGFYTGVFGIFDGQDVDSAVCIRYIEKEGDEYYYRSGGGITSMSDAASEYSEMVDKIYIPVSI